MSNSSKQRKLSDLRVIDLQRELHTFNITFDKKELKNSLIEKLRQALIDHNLDPDTYLFDVPSELKSISSDENNRTHEEIDDYQSKSSETLTMQMNSNQKFDTENAVQTNSSTTASLSTKDNNHNDDERIDRVNSTDKSDLRQTNQTYDSENDFPKNDNTTTKCQNENTIDDNNNNNHIHNNTSHENTKSITENEHDLTTISCSSSNGDLNGTKENQLPTNNRLFHSHTTTAVTSTTEQQSSPNLKHSEVDQETTTTNLIIDDDSLSKSETHRQDSTEEEQKQSKASTTNKDQCHLWVSNIAKETHASDLKELFSKYGKVLTTKVIGSSTSQWFGYINLATPDDVEKCINALNRTELHGKKIIVDREMHDQPSHSSSSATKSKSNNNRSSSSTVRPNSSPKKRSTSSNEQNKKKLSTSDSEKHDNYNKTLKSHQSNSNKRRKSSSSNNSQSSRPVSPRAKLRKSSEKSELSSKDGGNYKNAYRSDKLSVNSNEMRSQSSSIKPDYHRSDPIDRSKQRSLSYNSSNNYEKPKNPSSQDIHRTTTPRSLENDRRTKYENEQRLRHEKELIVRKRYAQQQEEEKIKDEQRRLEEERERMRREFEFLERERLEIERTRLELQREKEEQARELEKQQRRLADEAKHRQHQIGAKQRDNKPHRLPHNDNKRPHHLNTNNTSNSKNNNNNLNKVYDHRSSTNSSSGRDRSHDDSNRDYYPDAKRQYTNNQREPLFRDRVVYRESNLPMPSMNSNDNNNQRYLPSPSNQHRLPDPYTTLPQRGRDAALPPNSSISGDYDRSSRNQDMPATNSNLDLRRPRSRDRFEDREYLHQTQRRDRSPQTVNTLRREQIETTHWERAKSRDTAHYDDGKSKYLSNQYHSESSQPNQQQQGLWSAAPPTRPSNHHHSDFPAKDPYGWQHAPQQAQTSLSSHHPQGLPSSRDRSRTNMTPNQRISVLPSNQAPPPPSPASIPPSSSRSNATTQGHLYGHPNVSVAAIPTPQQHPSLVSPAPPTLHHTAAYVTQQAAPAGLVLHSAGQARTYEPHYVVTQPLPQRRY